VPKIPAGTRELTMKDVELESDEKTPYECFECGSIIIAEDAPGQCPDCGGPMRNRYMPFE
jgi:rubrerythrin